MSSEATADTPTLKPVQLGGKDNPRLVWAALARAQAAAQDVPRAGLNVAEGYAYTTAEDFVRAAKALLSKEKLVLIPQGTRMVEVEGSFDTTTRMLTRRWLLVHVQHGAVDLGEHAWPVVHSGHRGFDKAWAAADTASLGYFLRDLLQLPRSERGTGLDDDARPDRVSPIAIPPAKMGLAAAVTREFDRLNIAVEFREQYALELIGRHPSGIDDLNALVAALRGVKSPEAVGVENPTEAATPTH